MRQFVEIGGDMRCHYQMAYLKEQGAHVITYKVPDCENEYNGWEKLFESLRNNDAIEKKILLLPVPVIKDEIHINGCTELTIKDIADSLTAFDFVCGGVLPSRLTDVCTAAGIPYYDYMKDDCVALKNAVATAEGAIAESFMMSNINIENSKCLVTGYGRCGRVLAQKLLRMGAEVTVTARSVEACIKAAMGDCHTILLDQLGADAELDQFDFCFNTIPAPVLNRDILSGFRQDIVILDIASKPGGTDFSYLDERGIIYKHSLGIPGRYSPKASGEILGEAVLAHLPF